MRFIRLTRTDLDKIRILYESVMSKASHGLFYREGYALGREIANMVGDDQDNFIEAAAGLIKGRGWVEDITFNQGSVVVKGSIESVESASEPTCHRIRGIIHAVVMRESDKNIEISEVKCVSMGDPHCEFSLRETEEAENERGEEVTG